MPKTLERALRRPKRVQAPTRVPLSRQQCEALVDSGNLVGRYELIDGEIISKMGQKRPNSFTVVLLNAWLTGTFGSMRVQIQSPIDVAPDENTTNEPEPDGVALRDTAAGMSDRNPGPSDIELTVEVSDTTLQFDLRTKSALYSRAGILEYWVLDIVGRRLFVHHDPTGENYQAVVIYGEEELVAPLSKPDHPVRVADLLPPVEAERTEP